MRRSTVYLIALALAGIVAFVGIDLLVETDEEKIDAVLERLGSAAASGDAARIVPLVDLEGDGFEVAVGRHRERFSVSDEAGFEDRVAEASAWLDGGGLRIASRDLEIEGDRARAFLRVVVDRGGAEESIPVEVSLRRVDDAWRATRLRALRTPADRSARR